MDVGREPGQTRSELRWSPMIIAESRDDYLRHAEVARFVAFVRKALEGSQPFHHEFQIRDRRRPPQLPNVAAGKFKVAKLEQAFDSYWWDRNGFDVNKARLDAVQISVATAVQAECQSPSTADVLAHDALAAVLEWGAGGQSASLYRSNMAWAAQAVADSMEGNPGLAERLRAGRAVLDADAPDYTIFNASFGPRMNAGLTKYFSLACQQSIIYDGRVGAALGLLVRSMLELDDPQLPEVPKELRFPYGAQNPGKNRTAAQALNRNPSKSRFVFTNLGNRSMNWAMWNCRANWILTKAIAESNASWCKAADGLRRVEAALFTVGYCMP